MSRPWRKFGLGMTNIWYTSLIFQHRLSCSAQVVKVTTRTAEVKKPFWFFADAKPLHRHAITARGKLAGRIVMWGFLAFVTLVIAAGSSWTVRFICLPIIGIFTFMAKESQNNKRNKMQMERDQQASVIREQLENE